MKTYATLGPACCRADLLTELLDMGLTGFRLNLSHTTLTACRPWTDAVQATRHHSAPEVYSRRDNGDGGPAAQIGVVHTLHAKVNAKRLAHIADISSVCRATHIRHCSHGNER